MTANYKSLVVAFVFLAIGIFYFLYVPSTHQIGLNNTVFCIPQDKENLSILDQSKGSLFKITGADTSAQEKGGSFQVTLNPKLVKNNITAYKMDDHGLLANLVINLKSIPESELKKSLSGKTHENILKLQEEYADSNVSLDEASGHYRVSWSPAPPPYVIWHVLDRKPNPALISPSALNQYYIAYCSRAGGVHGKASNCMFHERYNNFLLTITTSEENLALKSELVSLSHKKLNEWMGLCPE